MLKSKDITLLTKVHIVKAMVFPVVMYRSESWTIKEVRALKNWYFQTVMLEKTLETPLESKEIKPGNPKGYQPWILFGRTDAEAEAPTLWPLDENSWLTGKDPDAGKDWRQKRVTEDETSGWHHWFSGHDLGQTPGDVRDSEVWYAAVYVVSWSRRDGHDLVIEQQQQKPILWERIIFSVNDIVMISYSYVRKIHLPHHLTPYIKI